MSLDICTQKKKPPGGGLSCIVSVLLAAGRTEMTANRIIPPQDPLIANCSQFRRNSSACGRFAVLGQVQHRRTYGHIQFRNTNRSGLPRFTGHRVDLFCNRL
jgi:hypothetical protein